eukprot:Tamp_23602.p3 GENE.Tamp_23602~~Tamp_23602.p3  ORF type:complete len:150 (-),score=28.22 Tamp_23602:51-500(-)
MPAAGDFFLIRRELFGMLGGYHQVPSTTHLDSLLLCKASGAGLRQIVLTRPCVLFHQKHPATDMEGNEVSDACINGKMGDQDCVNRFLLKGYELSDIRCEEVETEVAHVLSALPAFDDVTDDDANTWSSAVSVDPQWGFPDEAFADVTL